MFPGSYLHYCVALDQWICHTWWGEKERWVVSSKREREERYTKIEACHRCTALLVDATQQYTS
jgi:hypothetical protein